MLDHPAYFLTWHTYGTWLPGDHRGWVEGRASAETPVLSGDRRKRCIAGERMAGTPVLFDPQQRAIVEATTREVCSIRNWRLLAVNCRSNHVHVVVLALNVKPEAVMNSLKAWCSRRLNEADTEHAGRRWWVRHGSTRYLNSEQAVQQAIHYVVHEQ
jgi:REP element-mobilizing transposase RayT